MWHRDYTQLHGTQPQKKCSAQPMQYCWTALGSTTELSHTHRYGLRNSQRGWTGLFLHQQRPRRHCLTLSFASQSMPATEALAMQRLFHNGYPSRAA